MKKTKAKKNIYINAPFAESTAKEVANLAKRAKRSLGKQVVWIVERFMNET